jgi:hypothetical protein
VGARCYARDFLAALAREDHALRPAADAYARVAAQLLPVWQAYSHDRRPPEEALPALAASLRQAVEAEREGVAHLKGYLASRGSNQA